MTRNQSAKECQSEKNEESFFHHGVIRPIIAELKATISSRRAEFPLLTILRAIE